MDLYDWYSKEKKYGEMSIQMLAKLLETDPGRLSEVMRGKRFPSENLCRRIEKHTKGEVKPLDLMRFYYETQDRLKKNI